MKARAFVALLIVGSMLVGGSAAGTVVARAERPGFCTPVKKAYRALSEIEGSGGTAYPRAARLHEKAARSAHGEIAVTLRGLAAFYQRIADGDVPLDPSASQEVAVPTLTLNGVVEARCGFTILDADWRASTSRSRRV